MLEGNLHSSPARFALPGSVQCYAPIHLFAVDRMQTMLAIRRKASLMSLEEMQERGVVSQRLAKLMKVSGRATKRFFAGFFLRGAAARPELRVVCVFRWYYVCFSFS